MSIVITPGFRPVETRVLMPETMEQGLPLTRTQSRFIKNIFMTCIGAAGFSGVAMCTAFAVLNPTESTELTGLFIIIASIAATSLLFSATMTCWARFLPKMFHEWNAGRR